AVELAAIAGSLRAAGTRSAAAIGSSKALIGHTKAAAGLAGLTKAVLALEAEALPPTAAVERPHPLLQGEAPALRVLREVERWPADRPLRAAVSAMGFGGINTHVVLEAPAVAERRTALRPKERRLAASVQDGELLLFGGADPGELGRRVEAVAGAAAGLSRAELTDLACELQRSLGSTGARAAVVAGTPKELAARLQVLQQWLAQGVTSRLDAAAGVFLGAGARHARVGFLFPGQGSPTHEDGGLWRRRFGAVRALYDAASLPGTGSVSTDVAQPAIVTAGVAGLRVLAELGLSAQVAVGHSLGELVALHWAGALDEEALVRLSRARGRAMADLGAASGAMASLGLGPSEVEPLLSGLSASIAGYNSPRQTVISGDAASVDAAVARARQRGATAVRLKVSHAFHSPLVAAAAGPLGDHLARERLSPLRAGVMSTVTGKALPPGEDLKALLCRQVTAPVRFTDALAAAGEVDLWLEVGPGDVLSGLAGEHGGAAPAIPLDASGPSVHGLLRAVGAAYALGAPVKVGALFEGRFSRPFDLSRQPSFLENPCEQAPVSTMPSAPARKALAPGAREAAPAGPGGGAPEGQPPLDVIRSLVSAKAELPPEAIGEDDRLLGDLHLNSIRVSQVVVEAAKRLGLPPPASPVDYAQATVRTLAQALEELARTGGGAAAQAPSLPPGVDAWVRNFGVEWVERPRPPRAISGPGGEWKVLAPAGHPLAAALREQLTSASGPGVAVCLPAELGEAEAALLLGAAKAVLGLNGPARFLVVQHGGGGSAFARTLHIESPRVATCIADVPAGAAKAAEWAAAAAAACAAGRHEARYDGAGKREEPVLRPLAAGSGAGLPLGPGDVLLVTGGGKGISAECALDLAQRTGAAVALMGRSRPEADAELAANLARFHGAGLRCRYVVADVTDAAAVHQAVREAEAALGPVTAVLHGAGRNVPRLLAELDEATVLQTLAPKIAGAKNVLAAVSPERLRLFVAFGSIIGRVGMAGEADYALANDWMSRWVAQLGARLPRCRCLCIEWSVWSGVGMGERLGRVDALAREGISAIPPDRGLAILRELLSSPELPAVTVVSGRLGPHLPMEAKRPDLPFLRFLEHPRVVYPGIELVVDSEISGETDPSLDDHVYQGERLFAAVLGLEAMAQVVMAVTGSDAPPSFDQVSFDRPVVVPQRGKAIIRVAALVRSPGVVEVALRCEETSFQVDHFRATCRLRSASPAAGASANGSTGAEHWALPLEANAHQALVPERDLYGGLLFHTGRFRRITRYLRLKARECVAEISSFGAAGWFARYLPDTLVLGDPAVRDAAIHAIQACVPHARLLPAGVERIQPGNTTTPSEPVLISARERFQDGRLYVYDMEILDARGRVLERWEGLRLMAVEAVATPSSWPPSLLPPYLERRLPELLSGSSLQVALEREAGLDRRERSARAFQRLLDGAEVAHRPDGKPVAPDRGVSAAHSGALTLAVAGPGEVACDLESVESRPPSVWRELLGPERAALAELVSKEQAEALEVTATRVWSAMECMKKAGLPAETPLLFRSAEKDGWVAFTAGRRTIATLRLAIQEAGPLVAAVLPGAPDANV
ncbi:MAG TPA: SDR family NAD(P)-dependent oxidoreductase, partial [Myxococcales bacterium]|nr:SDR family NAD(P)-dependent oxidoreductase [Myxococcales bacterium]